MAILTLKAAIPPGFQTTGQPLAQRFGRPGAALVYQGTDVVHHQHTDWKARQVVQPACAIALHHYQCLPALFIERLEEWTGDVEELQVLYRRITGSLRPSPYSKVDRFGDSSCQRRSGIIKGRGFTRMWMLPEIEGNPGIGQPLLLLVLLADMHQRNKSNLARQLNQVRGMQVFVARPTGKDRQVAV